MTESTASSSTELAARAEASAWITRLHGPHRSPDMEAGFRRWLAERPENAAEFEGLTEMWDLVSAATPALRSLPRLERWEQSQEACELKALRDTLPDRHPRRSRVRALAALTLMITGVFVVGAYLFWRFPTYATDIGEQRVLQLADGTRVSLNSATRLVVTYRESERRLVLEKGEALFDVARDLHRPFIVVAGDREVTALGTSFVVRYEEGKTAVTLVEGRVSIASHDPGGAAARRLTLTPGQRMVLAPDRPPHIETPRIEAATAWRRGEVILDDTPLAEAVAEMNRYDKTAIVIDDPEIAALIVSGLYHTGDSDGFAQSVARMYALHADERGGRIHLKRH